MDIPNLAEFGICCEVCAEQFSQEKERTPRILKCGHSFCLCCLGKLTHRYDVWGQRIGGNIDNFLPHLWVYDDDPAYTTQICCPKCKTLTVIEGAMVDALPKNISYLSLIDDLVRSCINQQSKQDVCEEHPDYVLDMFCHDDEEATCLNCTVYGEHKTHQVSRLSAFADHKRNIIEKNKALLEDMVKECKSLEEKLETRRSNTRFTELRQEIMITFSAVQATFTTHLNAKLESMLEKLSEMQDAQSLLLKENETQIFNTLLELENMTENSENFLLEANERDLAKEEELVSNMEQLLEQVNKRELTTQHVYQVRIDDFSELDEIMLDALDSWVCDVCETKPALADNFDTIFERHPQCFAQSFRILFGEEEPSDRSCENPFDDIGFEWYSGD